MMLARRFPSVGLRRESKSSANLYGNDHAVHTLPPIRFCRYVTHGRERTERPVAAALRFRALRTSAAGASYVS